MPKMKVIGLTGSIGMGKSTAAKMLSEMGVPVHDADAAVHGLLAAGGKGVKPVGDSFPESLKIDDRGGNYIDRKTLGRIAFEDAAKKRKLEDILHPMVRAASDAFKAAMEKKGHDLVALDIPLLFETGGDKNVDVTLCVSAPADVQRQRVLARDGMTEERLARIIAEQMPDAEKRRRADYVLETNKSLDEMRRELAEIVRRIRTTAAD